MTLPTGQEINPHDDLDGRIACQHFLGKSVDDAVALFRDSDIYYQGDLRWMGPVAFRYYLPAAAQYICENPGDISDFVAHFAGTLEFRLHDEAVELAAVAAQIIELCDYLLKHPERYTEGIPFYGDMAGRYVSLRESFSQLNAGGQR